MNVLVVKGNNRPASESVSSKMYETFLEAIKDNKQLNVTIYDVFAEDMPYVGQDLFNAFGKLQSGEELLDIEQRILAAKQKAKDAFSKADVIVFVFPLWNLTIPAKLQTFIDYIWEAGYTFKYDENGNLVQLMKDKKIILLNARGGIYSTPETAPMDMSVNYMRTAFGGLFGMEIIAEVIIEGHNADPARAEEIIAEGLQKVTEAAKTLELQLA
ncbi:FMN-dependent NADH-azoreductase [Pallidibacillus pasinlerensis]|uniref:FMN dependent NADH:quinone oxidoreductase n=1 Tax=Pallidibacillus pasinlerensis TaxID=2703818 RepID=A0ABX0A1X8_9BACI|nr:FMN-dependent NADH-azoreductase [Pallidibacillus pasinlerensis]NCU17366.1 FMN-dependent NADH-azoreductase [Pallidibacillus pasinlerensis]